MKKETQPDADSEPLLIMLLLMHKLLVTLQLINLF